MPVMGQWVQYPMIMITINLNTQAAIATARNPEFRPGPAPTTVTVTAPIRKVIGTVHILHMGGMICIT